MASKTLKPLEFNIGIDKQETEAERLLRVKPKKKTEEELLEDACCPCPSWCCNCNDPLDPCVRFLNNGGEGWICLSVCFLILFIIIVV